MHALLLALSGLLSATAPAAPADTTLRVTALRTEYLSNPLGSDARRPRLSWGLVSAARNTIQIAYQVAVSTDSAGLRAGRSLVWNSGRVPSARSVFVEYAGPALRSGTRYYWHVRVWDRARASDWSTTSWWETGLLDRSDWTARWIRPPDAQHDSAGGPAPMLRRTFTLAGPVRSARLYVTSLGLYEVELNGHGAAPIPSRPAGRATGSDCSTRPTTSPGCSPPAGTRSGRRSATAGTADTSASTTVRICTAGGWRCCFSSPRRACGRRASGGGISCSRSAPDTTHSAWRGDAIGRLRSSASGGSRTRTPCGTGS